MTDLTALKALLAKVEAGDGPLSSHLPVHMMTHWPKIMKAHDGSLDAALALKDAVLPEWGWQVSSTDGVHLGRVYQCIIKGPFFQSDEADTPARALTIAILKAKIAEGDITPDTKG